MKTELRFTLDGQKLRRIDDNTVASNAVNVPTALFENLRENEWAGFGSYTAEFKNGNTVISVPLVGVNKCAVPHEVLSPGYMCVTVYAESVDGGEISASITSTEAEVRIERGPSKHGDNSRAPTADEVTVIQAAAEAAASVRADADAGKFNGEVGATPNITIGTVTTLDAGSEATATLTGTTEAPILNLGIPMGKQGINGKSLYAVSNIDELYARCKEYSTVGVPSSIESVCVAEGLDITIWSVDSEGKWMATGLYTMKAGCCYKVSFTRIPAGVRVTAVTETISFGGNISDEQIQTAVNNYLTENPPEGGDSGADGKSAYEIWLEQGNEGTEADFIESLKGKDGNDGYTPLKGKDYNDGKDGNGISSVVLNADYTLTLHFTNGTSHTTPSIRGESGATGAKGSDGISVRSVKQTITSNEDDGENVITVTLSNGQTATFTVKNGKTGGVGDTGKTPNITIGTVTTLTEGSNATATITGTAENPILNLGIPKGDMGKGADIDTSAIMMKEEYVRDTGETIAPYTNILDKYGYKSRTYLGRNGEEVIATYNVWTTNFIPLKKGQVLRIKFNDRSSINKTNTYWGLYDENKTISTSYNITYNLDTIEQYNTYGDLVVNGNTAIWDTSTIAFGGWNGFAYARLMLESLDCIITIDEEITDDVKPIYELKPTLKVPRSNLEFNAAEKPLVGKKVICFGDSLFGRTRDETSALYKTAQITGADLYNVGFGGTSMSRLGSGAYSYFSFPALVDSIISNTWTNQDNNVSTVEHWSEQLEKLRVIDFSNVDIVVLHYGTNDFAGGDRSIDNASDIDDITSICGGLRYGLNKMLTAYPQIKFYISVPVFRYWGSEGSYSYPDTYTNAKGNTLLDVIEGLRKVAIEYNLPVIDGYYGMGINKLNAAYYLADQTHHNIAGMKLFGEFIAAQLSSQQNMYANVTDGYSKDEIDTMFGTYIDDLADLIGGNA
ncbi:MAG: SGNH/GDSL hydrolase family protein [Ruminococcaceae bacterium]|nr:SGNH/GDSL hydrolase family protein [Oscillospiraceae bacterium]